MYVLNTSQPLILLLILVATVLLIVLGKETKNSLITAIPLFGFLALLVLHVFQLVLLPEDMREYGSVLTRCLLFDFIFIFMTFFAYLWVDDIECRVKKKKSIDNSLDWFWNKV